MRRVTATLGILSVVAALGGCATLTRSPNTAWQVNTFPSGATVETSNGHFCEATPCLIAMPRRSKFTATVTHRGYKPQVVAVTHHLSANGAAAFLGNGLIGGVPGAAIDIITGSTLDLFPQASVVHLERDKDYYPTLYGYNFGAEPSWGFDILPGDTVTVTRF